MRPHGGFTSGSPARVSPAAAAVAAAADADVVHVRALRIVHHRQHAQQRVRVDVEHAGFGIERTARPVGAVRDVAACRSCRLRRCAIGGVKSGPILYCETIFSASALSSGVKSIRSSFEEALALERRRLGRERLRRRVPLARHRALSRPAAPRSATPAGRSRDRTRTAKPCLVGCATALIRRAVDGDVGQDRRARNVVVPDRVVHELEVPDALAGLAGRRATRLSPNRLLPGRWPPK